MNVVRPRLGASLSGNLTPATGSALSVLKVLVSMLVVGVSLICSTSARADDDNKDQSAGAPFTTAMTCVQSSGGFDPKTYALLPIPAGGFINHQSHSALGFIVQNPDGTQSTTYRNTSLTHQTFRSDGVTLNRVFPSSNAALPGNPVNVSEITCTGQVEVQDDGSRVFRYGCTGNIVAGSDAGRTFDFTGAASLTLVDESEIGFAGTLDRPTIETSTLKDAHGNVIVTYERVCTRTTVLSSKKK